MKLFKVLVLGIAILIGVLIVTCAGLFVFIDTLARDGVEQGASYALGVDTSLDKADVGVMSGTFTMSGLDVANPEGFSSPHFLHLDDAGVSVSLGTLGKDTVELPALTLTGVDVNLQKSGGESNYGVILDNLKRFESSGQSATKPPDQGKKFIIQKVEIRNVLVHADLAPIGGELTKLEVPIDQVTLTDVGSESGKGVVLSELSGVLVKAILAAVVNKAAGIFPDDMLNQIGSGLGSLTDLSQMGIGVAMLAGGQVVDLSGKAVQAASEAASDAVKGAVGEAGKTLGDVQKAAQGTIGETAGKAADKAKDALKGIGGLIPGAKKDAGKDQKKDKTKDDGGG